MGLEIGRRGVTFGTTVLAGCVAALCAWGCGSIVPADGLVLGTQAQLAPNGVGNSSATSRIAAAVGAVQTQDPTGNPQALILPQDLAARGDSIALSPGAMVITNLSSQLFNTPLSDIDVVTFQNNTGFDVFIRFVTDGDQQGILVYNGESLVIQYPCLNTIQLLSADEFDPAKGQYVDTQDLFGATFDNGANFQCGDVFVMPLNPNGLLGTPTTTSIQP